MLPGLLWRQSHSMAVSVLVECSQTFVFEISDLSALLHHDSLLQIVLPVCVSLHRHHCPAQPKNGCKCVRVVVIGANLLMWKVFFMLHLLNYPLSSSHVIPDGTNTRLCNENTNQWSSIDFLTPAAKYWPSIPDRAAFLTARGLFLCLNAFRTFSHCLNLLCPFHMLSSEVQHHSNLQVF